MRVSFSRLRWTCCREGAVEMSDELTLTINIVTVGGLTYHGPWRDLLQPETEDEVLARYGQTRTRNARKRRRQDVDGSFRARAIAGWGAERLQQAAKRNLELRQRFEGGPDIVEYTP